MAKKAIKALALNTKAVPKAGIEEEFAPKPQQFPDQPKPSSKVPTNRPVALPTPNSMNLQYGLPSFNAYTALSESAFWRMMICSAVAVPVDTLGRGIAKLDVVVCDSAPDDENGGAQNTQPQPGMDPAAMPGMQAAFPPNANAPAPQPSKKVGPKTERGKAIQELVDGTIEMATFLRRAPWCMPLACLFWQKFWKYDPELGVVGDMRRGERLPLHAGGLLQMSAEFDKITAGKNYSPLVPKAEQKTQDYDVEDFLYLEPTGSPSPQGNFTLPFRLNRIAELFDDSLYHRGVFVRQHSLPYLYMKFLYDVLQPTLLQGKLQEGAEDAARLDPMSVLGLGEKNILDYAEPRGTGAAFLLDHGKDMKAMAQEEIFGVAMLSDPRALGPTSTQKESRTTSNDAVISFARFCGCLLSTQWLPTLIAKNDMWIPGLIPARKPDEMEPWIELCEPGLRAADPNKVKGPASDAKTADKRPMPEGNGQKNTMMEKKMANMS